MNFEHLRLAFLQLFCAICPEEIGYALLICGRMHREAIEILKTNFNKSGIEISVEKNVLVIVINKSFI